MLVRSADITQVEWMGFVFHTQPLDTPEVCRFASPHALDPGHCVSKPSGWPAAAYHRSAEWGEGLDGSIGVQ